MKKKLFIIISLVLLSVVMLQILCGCFMFSWGFDTGSDKLSTIDLDNTTIVEPTTDPTLIVDKVLSNEPNTTTQEITFPSALYVTSFALSCYETGSYVFSSKENAEDIEVLVHTGHILEDSFRSLPFELYLEKGYRYTVEVKATDSKLLGKTVELMIDRPKTINDRDISDCISFVDTYTKGNVLRYKFVPTVTGKYFFSVENNNRIRLFKENKLVDYTGWGTYYSTFTKGVNYTFEVELKPSVQSGTIEGVIYPPFVDTDITEQMSRSDFVVLKLSASYDYKKGLKLTFTPKTSTDYIISINHVDTSKLWQSGIDTTSCTITDAKGLKLSNYKSGYKIEAMQGESVTLKIVVDRAQLKDKDTYVYIAIYNSWLEDTGEGDTNE